ncbi:MAG: hypothetical protein JWL95_2843 [Gemmatimonadetes bacterium]|nr:hypothetical protein [Gemmatimonadota bacterium]
MSTQTSVLIIAAAAALGLAACNGNESGPDAVAAPAREPTNSLPEVSLGTPSLSGFSSGGAPVLRWTSSARAAAVTPIDYRVIRTTWNAVVGTYSEEEAVVATLQSIGWTDSTPPYSYGGAPTDVQPDSCFSWSSYRVLAYFRGVSSFSSNVLYYMGPRRNYNSRCWSE